jgi:hypothetical protein
MLKLPAEVRVFISLEPCDMRRQLDGLAALVRAGMGATRRTATYTFSATAEATC